MDIEYLGGVIHLAEGLSRFIIPSLRYNSYWFLLGLILYFFYNIFQIFKMLLLIDSNLFFEIPILNSQPFIDYLKMFWFFLSTSYNVLIEIIVFIDASRVIIIDLFSESLAVLFHKLELVF